MLRRFLQDERGQIAEIILYVALALIAIGVIAIVAKPIQTLVANFITWMADHFTWLRGVFPNTN